MALTLEIIFILLVIADTVFTYYLISHAYYREAGPLMKRIIKYPVFTVIVTVLATLLILLLINESKFYLWLIPLNLFLIGVLIHNVKVWRA